MNGLLSGTPSSSAIRLTVGGFGLLWVQCLLLLAAPGLSASFKLPISMVAGLAAAALLLAVVGIPDPAPFDWRRRHGR